MLYLLTARDRAQAFHPAGNSACTFSRAKTECGGDGCAVVVARIHAQLTSYVLAKGADPVNVFTHGLKPALLTTLIRHEVADQTPTRRGEPCNCGLGDRSRRVHPETCSRRARNIARWVTTNPPRWLADPLPSRSDRAVLRALAADLRSASCRGDTTNYLAAAWQAVHGTQPGVTDLAAADQVRQLIDRVASASLHGEDAMRTEIIAPLDARRGDTPLAFDPDRGGFHLEPPPSGPDTLTDDHRSSQADDSDNRAHDDSDATQPLDTGPSAAPDLHFNTTESECSSLVGLSLWDTDPCQPTQEQLLAISGCLKLTPDQHVTLDHAVNQVTDTLDYATSYDLPTIRTHLHTLRAITEDLINLRPDITNRLELIYGLIEDHALRTMTPGM